MTKPARSSSPLALSVAAITVPGDVGATIDRIMEFDDAKIGFTHAGTWAALPVALRGVINSESDHLVFAGTHPRVESCIRALCRLGESMKVETRKFSDHPNSGLRPINDIEWGPGVTLKVKGVCWFVEKGVPIIPLLQPRKTALSEERVGLYATLGRHAFCRGDWYNAKVSLVDLSGEDKVASASYISDHEVPRLSDTVVASFVRTYVEAKLAVDAIRAARPKQPPKPKGDDLFDPKGPS